MHARRPAFAVVAHAETATTSALVRACTRFGLAAEVLAPDEALAKLRPGDTALARLDVRPTLDGIEPGLWELRVLEREGVRVLNRAAALVASHDKLATVARLLEAGLPHPQTRPLESGGAVPLRPPLVLKPRFGSWGRDVIRCDDEADVAAALAQLARREWFDKTGAVVQALVPPTGRDLRIVVAGGAVVGAIERIAAPGEWRTNVSLGASRRGTIPPPDACALALATVAAIGADLAGVDLLPLPGGGWTVLEVNGAVDFMRQYRRSGDVFATAVDRLLGAGARASRLVGAP